MKYASLENGQNDLVRALLLAKKLGHRVIVKNYDEDDRYDKTPMAEKFNFDTIMADNETLNVDMMPVYVGDGCNDVVICVLEGAEYFEYSVWYSDDDEDRVYTDEIDSYLFRYDPMQMTLEEMKRAFENVA